MASNGLKMRRTVETYEFSLRNILEAFGVFAPNDAAISIEYQNSRVYIYVDVAHMNYPEIAVKKENTEGDNY